MTVVRLTLDPGKLHAGWAARTVSPSALFACGVERIRLPKTPAVRRGTHDNDGSGPPAVAWAVCDALVRAGVTGVHDVVSEFPQIYAPKQGRSKTRDPDAMLFLAATVGAVSALVRPEQGVRVIQPREWKGQVPDEIFWRRIRGCLAPDERAIAIAAGCYDDEGCLGKQFHHGLEAIGLGLWADMLI